MTKTITLKDGKIQYYYNGKLLRTSYNNYKYALIKVYEDGDIYVKKFSNSLQTINTYFNYITKGYGKELKGSGLWSSQFENPNLLKIITF